MNEKIFIILVAGGKGTRMGSETPKQFHLVAGKPLIMHTFDAFVSFYGKAEFLLVLPEIEIGRWKHLCVEYEFSLPHRIVEGGPTRYHSVKNALSFVDKQSLVIVHDAVRPLLSENTLLVALKIAHIHGTAIPVIPITESLRHVENGINRAVNREHFRIVQTPQVFRSDILKKAYLQVFRDTFTDDAAVVENAGYQLHLVEGNPENIKVTHTGDIGYVENLLLTKRLN